jgi:hypothetical protein
LWLSVRECHLALEPPGRRHYDEIVRIDPTTAYFIGNRVWWSVALFVSPIAGAIAGQPAAAFLAAAVLVLPSFVLFDTDRPWWPDQVKHLPQDQARTRSETRKLTIASGAALIAGLGAALLLPWG